MPPSSPRQRQDNAPVQDSVEYKPVTNCFNSRAWLSYLKHLGIDTASLRDGLDDDESWLMEERNWIPADQMYRLATNISARFPDDPDLFRTMAFWATQGRISHNLTAIFGSLLSPEALFRSMPRRMALFNRHRNCELVSIKGNCVIIRIRHKTHVRAQKNICDWTRGLLEAAPLLTGSPPAKAHETSCECDGAEACIYEIELGEKAFFLKRLNNLLQSRSAIVRYQMEVIEENHAHLLNRYEELRRARDEIARHNAELETRVAERTRELDRTVRELKQAMSEIKTLGGLIPICCSCRKIRDDDGYWSQLETYIQKHSGAEFSHGICPGCLSSLYPDLAAKYKKEFEL